MKVSIVHDTALCTTQLDLCMTQQLCTTKQLCTTQHESQHRARHSIVHDTAGFVHDTAIVHDTAGFVHDTAIVHDTA